MENLEYPSVFLRVFEDMMVEKKLHSRSQAIVVALLSKHKYQKCTENNYKNKR
jgi:hypothetical protein